MDTYHIKYIDMFLKDIFILGYIVHYKSGAEIRYKEATKTIKEYIVKADVTKTILINRNHQVWRYEKQEE